MRVRLLRSARSRRESEPPSSSGLGRRPFTAVTGIRTPLGVLNQPSSDGHGPVVQLGVHAALSRRRPRVQIPSGPPETLWGFHPGRVAQLVERAPEKREVTGSTPVPATLRQSRRIAPPHHRCRRRDSVRVPGALRPCRGTGGSPTHGTGGDRPRYGSRRSSRRAPSGSRSSGSRGTLQPPQKASTVHRRRGVPALLPPDEKNRPVRYDRFR